MNERMVPIARQSRHTPEAAQLLTTVRSSERKLLTFIERVAKNRNIAEKLPNHHKFMASVYNFYAVRGQVTPKQKIAVNAELDKYANEYVVLMTSRPQQTDEQIEREAIQNEHVSAQPDDAPLPEE